MIRILDSDHSLVESVVQMKKVVLPFMLMLASLAVQPVIAAERLASQRPELQAGMVPEDGGYKILAGLALLALAVALRHIRLSSRRT